MEGKKTKGRQKIEMKLIENTEDKLITFSKRRSGINKRASELVTLTGAEIAFVVFSPAGKPFSFGHPSTDSVIRRYLGHEQQGSSDVTEQIVEAHRQIKINDLNNHHNQLIHKLDSDNQKMKDLKASIDGSSGEHMQGWWETPIEEHNFSELVEVKNAYNKIFSMISAKHHEKTAGGASTSSAHPNPTLNQLSLGNNDIDHLGIAQMSGPPFEAGAGSGVCGPQFEAHFGCRGGGGGPQYEVGSSSGGGGPQFEVGSGDRGGVGPPVSGPALSDQGHQWGAF